jgi:SAM-dependent methyltransferase
MKGFMSIEILTNRTDNVAARAEMRRQSLHFITPWLVRALHRARIVKGADVGLNLKSWDVLRTLQFLEQRVCKTQKVLDLGAYGSEVLFSLNKMGFSNLTGIDLNPSLERMPRKPGITYVTGDFTATTFCDETFGAITAISVLEHGFSGAKVFREIARILKTGGYFVGSTDYWPEKIDTSDTRAYGLDWTIFSRDELLAFISEAGRFGLVPVGSLNFQASEKTVRWSDREYTFAWFAFRKVARNDSSVHRDSEP